MQRIYDYELKTFNNDKFGTISVFTDDRNWFMMSDIIETLNINKNLEKSMKEFYTEGIDYKSFKVHDSDTHFVIKTLVSEQMLYRFLLEGDSDKCKLFRFWLSETVLPSLSIIDDFNTDNISNFISMEIKTLQAAYELDKPLDAKNAIDSITDKIVRVGVENSTVDNKVLDWIKYEEFISGVREHDKKKNICPEWIKELVRK